MQWVTSADFGSMKFKLIDKLTSHTHGPLRHPTASKISDSILAPLRFATTMAPPATKRRKLDRDVSSVSDADEFSENALDGTDEDQSTSDADSDPGPTKTQSGRTKEQRPKEMTGSGAIGRKRHGEQLQDGVYTAETFKSNLFKLQVDALLAQVKVKYGKKEAPAEHAMRTLKALLEQLPAREPMTVGRNGLTALRRADTKLA